ncbi:hypothetical protein [Aquisalimonas asiatica]|uniref:Uncharacterized protein n=1 Tax=Aquisalimonas asiatica TaxID=406100 RepID=A0A1H8UEL6_9GAMM|nr:hypothetical protein [Aquisalimonas asiatica]SEP01068.1 hypothetical protein SAMN04488052_106107 [Aquisalimonas asiatica]
MHGTQPQPQPLELELQLSADDWLLENGADTRQPAYRGGGGGDALAAADDRSGSGFRVGPVVPALCEDDLPGTSTVVDAYSRAMECEDDQIGLSVSIRNY